MIIFGYQTLTDLGFIRTNLLSIGAAAEESYPGVEVKVDYLADFLESGQQKKSRLNCCHRLFMNGNGMSPTDILGIHVIFTTTVWGKETTFQSGPRKVS